MKRVIGWIVLVCMLCASAQAVVPVSASCTLLSKDSMWYAYVEEACIYSRSTAVHLMHNGVCYIVIADGEVSLYWPDLERLSPILAQEGNHEPYMAGLKYSGTATVRQDTVEVDFGSCTAEMALQEDGLLVTFRYGNGVEAECLYKASVSTGVDVLPAKGTLLDMSQNGAWLCDLQTGSADNRYYWNSVMGCSELLISDGRIYLLGNFTDTGYVSEIGMRQGRLHLPHEGYVTNMLPRCYSPYITTDALNYRIGAVCETERGLEVVFPAMDVCYSSAKSYKGLVISEELKADPYWGNTPSIALAGDPYWDITDALPVYTIPEVRMLITQQEDGSLSVACADAPGVPVLTYRPCVNLNVPETYAGQTWYPSGTVTDTQAKLSVSATKKGVLSFNNGKKSAKIKTAKIEDDFWVFLEAGQEEKKSLYFKAVKNKHRGDSRQQTIVQEGAAVAGGKCYQLAEGAMQGKVVSTTIDEATGFLWVETSKGLRYRYCYAPFDFDGIYLQECSVKAGGVKGTLSAERGCTGNITCATVYNGIMTRVAFDAKTPPEDVVEQPAEYAAIRGYRDRNVIDDAVWAEYMEQWKNATITIDEEKYTCTVKIGKKKQQCFYYGSENNTVTVAGEVFQVSEMERGFYIASQGDDTCSFYLLPVKLLSAAPEGFIGTWGNVRLVLDGNAEHPWPAQLTHAETEEQLRITFAQDNICNVKSRLDELYQRDGTDYIYFCEENDDTVRINELAGTLTIKDGQLHWSRPDKGYTLVYEQMNDIQ